MKYKKSFLLLWVTVGIAVLLAVLEFITKPAESYALAALGIILLGMLQTVLFFRCPHCKKRWDVRKGIPRACPYCGKPIKK